MQSLITTDETAAIVKYSEYVVKVKDRFTVLEEESLIKAEKIPKSFLKTLCSP